MSSRRICSLFVLKRLGTREVEGEVTLLMMAGVICKQSANMRVYDVEFLVENSLEVPSRLYKGRISIDKMYELKESLVALYQEQEMILIDVASDCICGSLRLDSGHSMSAKVVGCDETQGYVRAPRNYLLLAGERQTVAGHGE